MKSPAKRAILLLVCVVLASSLIAGCEEEKGLSEDGKRKLQLLTTENNDLKAQLQKCQKDLEEQKNLVEQLKKQKAAPAPDMSIFADTMMRNLVQQNQKLTEENAKLKEQLGLK